MSKNYQFTVRSSDGVSNYVVVIFVSELNAVIRCSCPAGIKGKLCKHKVSLLSNDVSILADEQQERDLGLVLQGIDESPALVELQNYKQTLLNYNAAQAFLENAKKRLEKTLNGIRE